jgi:hypothetical protein
VRLFLRKGRAKGGCPVNTRSEKALITQKYECCSEFQTFPSRNGPDNGDGTGELFTATKGTTREDRMSRIDRRLLHKPQTDFFG